MRSFPALILVFLLFSCQDGLLAPQAGDPYPGAIPPDTPQERIELLTPPLRIAFDDFPRAIPVPAVTPARDSVFNADAEGDFITEYTQPDMADTLDGYVTENRRFFAEVLRPAIESRLDSLKSLPPYLAVNALTLFLHESFQKFFGLNYYRWGGDITDRDQPQTAGHTRSTKRYGMDCSGFAASPYESAVLLGILDSTEYAAAFSCFGFRHICETDPAISDGGGRNGTTNNFRLEVSDMAKVGHTVTLIEAGSTPTAGQMELMQAGDLVIKRGHAGILVEISEELYFLESGGSTLSEDGLYTPYRAQEALADFAAYRDTEIRRCLPDKGTISGIRH